MNQTDRTGLGRQHQSASGALKCLRSRTVNLQGFLVARNLSCAFHPSHLDFFSLFLFFFKKPTFFLPWSLT